MIANVRQWTPMALPRFAKRVINARKANAAEKAELKSKGTGFFESYEKLLETQAVLILGLNNKRW
jgi:hypothetical protein